MGRRNSRAKYMKLLISKTRKIGKRGFGHLSLLELQRELIKDSWVEDRYDKARQVQMDALCEQEEKPFVRITLATATREQVISALHKAIVRKR